MHYCALVCPIEFAVTFGTTHIFSSPMAYTYEKSRRFKLLDPRSRAMLHTRVQWLFRFLATAISRNDIRSSFPDDWNPSKNPVHACLAFTFDTGYIVFMTPKNAAYGRLRTKLAMTDTRWLPSRYVRCYTNW